jgi:hypothetical protein
MHVCSTLWTGLLTDDLQMDAATRADHQARRAIHYRRILEDGAIDSQPFSEGGAAAAGAAAFGTTAKRVEGGFLVNGKKIFASLSGHANQYGILCTDVTDGTASRRNTLYLAIPADAPGVSVAGEWDPLGMRGTVSRNLLFADVFVRRVSVDLGLPLRKLAAFMTKRKWSAEDQSRQATLERLRTSKSKVSDEIGRQRSNTSLQETVEPTDSPAISSEVSAASSFGRQIESSTKSPSARPTDENNKSSTSSSSDSENYTSRLLEAKRKAQKKNP